MSSEPNNPAGRLLRICDSLRKTGGRQSIGSAWAAVLAIDERDKAKLLAAIGATMQLVEDTKAAVEALPEEANKQLYLSWEEKVVSAFSLLNLTGGSVNQVQQILDAETIARLEFVDETLSKSSPEPTLDEDELADILAELRNVTDLVVQSQLPSEVRGFLLDKLDALERAIEIYRVSGTKPITQVLESAVGAVAMRGTDFHKDTKESEQGRKFWAIAGRIATLMTVYEQTKNLLEYFSEFLD